MTHDTSKLGKYWPYANLNVFKTSIYFQLTKRNKHSIPELSIALPWVGSMIINKVWLFPIQTNSVGVNKTTLYDGQLVLMSFSMGLN